MKKIIFLSALIPLFLYSCKKGDSQATNYTVSGTRNFDLNTSNDADSFTVSVTDASNLNKTVALSVEGLPANAQAIITPSSGMPPFSSKVKIVTSGAAPGTYSLNIVAKNTQGASARFPFMLVAGDYCGKSLSGYYYAQSGGVEAVINGNTSDTIIFSNFIAGPNVTMYGIVNCGAHTIDVPYQHLPLTGATIYMSGQGTFSSNYKTIHMSLTENFNGSTSSYPIDGAKY
ncbi:hypothetical protein ACTHGU_14585 [Chitinophagaceae bacterium MMS25-I14]